MNRLISYCLIISLFGIIQLHAQVPTANLKLWLKADAGTSTTADGQPVSTWADQSGNGNNATQPTTSYEPTYVASSLNGKPALHFTSTNGSYLILPTDSVLGIQNSDYEIFIVARTDSSTISFLISSGNVENFEMHLNGAAGARFIPTGSTYIDEGSSGRYANNSPHIFDAQASSTGGLIRVDGVNGGDTLTNVRSSTNSELVLGMRLSVLSYFFTGDISEVLIYNKVLSASDRIIVESYLASKYGISYSNFAVNTTSDADSGSYNVGTLRYVMNQINTNASSNTSYVDLSGITGTITLTSALPAINYDTKITGPGASNLTISGNKLYRPFFIGQGTTPFSSSSPASPNVTLQGFSISNGYGVGGDGWNGGGGAAGMGGALFINAGTVTIDSIIFSGNKAVGGYGSYYYGNVTAGGGGFGGSAVNSGPGSGGLLGDVEGGGSGAISIHRDGYPGGFGGGGGEGLNAYNGNGGSGGFGGGGGSGSLQAIYGGGFGGAGGFAAGYGANNYGGGGGGAGLGGAIFNRNGAMVIKNTTFNNDTAAGSGSYGSGGTGSSYGGAVFNYSGSYYFSNVSYGTGLLSNSSSLDSNYYIYSGSSVLPTASLLIVTNLTGTSATINGSVNTNNVSTSYRFIYGTNPSGLSDTLSLLTAGSSGTVNVSANLTGLTSGTFYYFRLLTSNSFGADTSVLGSFIYDTSISHTNLKLWLASDSGVDTSAGKVTEWFDKSGNNNNATQSASAYEPSLQTSVINSKPAISFDGSATYLTLPAASTLGITNSGYEIFIVAKSSSNNLQFLEGGTPTNYELQLNGGLGARFIPSGSNFLDEGNNYDYTNGQAHIFDLKVDTSEGQIRIDGVAGGYVLSNAQSSDAGNLNIGRRGDGTYYFNGDVAEVIIYNTSLTSSQRLAVANYLSQKYNTTYTTVSKPTVQASNLTFSNITNNSITLKINKGNGAYRIIIAKSGSAVDMIPSDGQVYTANSAFGSGAQLSIAGLANHNAIIANPKLTSVNSGNGKIVAVNSKENLTLAGKTKMPVFKTQNVTNTGSGDYVVYVGTDSLVTVTGLNSNTSYYFSAFEFNGTNTDQSYLTTSPATGNTTTTYNPPTISILPDSAKISSSVYFRGVINPNGASTTYKFLYGTNLSSLTDSTSAQSLGADTTNDTIRVQITGLAYGTLYYHELLATNSGGTDTSSIGVAAIDTSIPGTNLKLWLRSDEGTSSSTDNTSISTWYDLSGNINNAVQTTAANQPLIRTNVINGHPVIRFDGSTSSLNLPTTGTLGIQNSGYEIFIAAKTSYTANPEFLISGASAQYEIHLNGGVGMRFIPLPINTYLDEGTSAQYSDGSPHVFSVSASSIGGASRVDGIDGGTSSSDLQDTNNVAFTLGTRYGGSLPFNGDIAEVIIYNSVLGASDRSKVEKYLGTKYNINSGALPVELTTFTAASTNSANSSNGSVAIELNWATATEVNNYGFDVEMRPQTGDGGQETADWMKIGFVKGNGNSNSPKNYSFVDNSPVNGSAEYRLKQIDNDGNFKYSSIVKVTSVPTQFSLEQNYPNPFNPTTAIRYSLPFSSNVELTLYNMLGQQVKVLVNGIQSAGYYKYQWNADNFASGVYIYVLSASSTDGRKNYQSIKKMILLK